MKREIPPQHDPLLSLLDEWEVQPEPSPAFAQRLQARIREHESRRQNALAGWWVAWRRGLIPGMPSLGMVAAAAVLVLVVAVGALVQLGPSPSPANQRTAVVQMAQVDPMVRDLQTLDRDGELLDHLDFLSAPQPAAVSPRVQDRN
ncbi:MAG: hypothetical protein ACRD2D_06000 [Terriglobales bacterium]